jgi:hypothetical protein
MDDTQILLLVVWLIGMIPAALIMRRVGPRPDPGTGYAYAGLTLLCWPLFVGLAAIVGPWWLIGRLVFGKPPTDSEEVL